MKVAFIEGTKNKVEVLDKEEVYALLNDAIQSGELPLDPTDRPFVTKLKDPITGVANRIVMCTQAVFNELVALGQLAQYEPAYFLITDDTTAEDLEGHMDQIDADVDALETRTSSLETRMTATEIHFVGDVLPTDGLEAMLDLCRAYWSGDGTSLECYATMLGDQVYFKRGATYDVVYFEGRLGTGVAVHSSGSWSITYQSEAEYIGHTSALTEKGLYIVSIKTGATNTDPYVTLPISVHNLEVYAESCPSRTLNGIVYYAMYDPTDQKIHVKETGGTTVGGLFIVYLVSKY